MDTTAQTFDIMIHELSKGTRKDLKGTASSNGKLPQTPPSDVASTYSEPAVVPIQSHSHSPTSDRHAFRFCGGLPKAQRKERRPIPDDKKDECYYEKRKRNNEAAQRSRYNRKLREDSMALQVLVLEKENSILRAQVNCLREETEYLRNMLSVSQCNVPTSYEG